MKLKGLERLKKLRDTLHSHAKMVLKRQQQDLDGVHGAQDHLEDPLRSDTPLTPGSLLHELQTLSDALNAQAKELQSRVREAQAAHDERAREAKQMEELVDRGRDELDTRNARYEQEMVENWLRNRGTHL